MGPTNHLQGNELFIYAFTTPRSLHYASRNLTLQLANTVRTHPRRPAIVRTMNQWCRSTWHPYQILSNAVLNEPGFSDALVHYPAEFFFFRRASFHLYKFTVPSLSHVKIQRLTHFINYHSIGFLFNWSYAHP